MKTNATERACVGLLTDRQREVLMFASKGLSNQGNGQTHRHRVRHGERSPQGDLQAAGRVHARRGCGDCSESGLGVSRTRQPSVTRRGVHNIHDLKLRCEVTPDGCWLWEGRIVCGRPSVHIAGSVVLGARITAVVLGRAAQRQPEQRWYVKCGKRECLSPKCLALGTHSDAHNAARMAGRLARDAADKARLRVRRRSRDDVRPRWMVEWALEAPQSGASVAHALGVDRSTVGLWRRAEKRGNDITGPFAQLLRAAG